MTHSKPSVAVCRSGKVRVRGGEGDPYDVLLRLPTGSLVMVDGKVVYEDIEGKPTVEIHVPQFQTDTVVKVKTRPIPADSGTRPDS